MSHLARSFETFWRQLGGPDLTAEYRFHPTRRWRFDFAHVPSRTAFELDGGTFTHGRHVRGKGFSNDCEKINTAQLLGWRVFRFTADMLDSDPAGHIEPVVKLVNG